ncbi:MAG: hypothetical protein LH481_14190 [Burkholderiales bacterium]|nr:hypothetical protein [Burkholderiales bacterium]
MSTPASKSLFGAIGPFAIFAGALVCAIAMSSTALHAQGFSAVISPPRFEVLLQPGKTSRQVIEITHVSSQSGKYRVYTNDWSLGEDGNAVFTEELAPNSCRPWVALEKRELSLGANGKIRFRFEISAPPDAVSMECRFGIMIEGLEQVIKTEGSLSFPVSGRVGVIVYATVGDARPKLEITNMGAGLHEGNLVPQLQVSNSGNAHGRLGGFVSGVDATGQKIDFVPEALPILPARTRIIPLVASVPGGAAVKVTYPLTVKGNLEWSDQKTAIDFRFDAPASKAAPTSTTLLPAPKAPPLVPGPAAK